MSLYLAAGVQLAVSAPTASTAPVISTDVARIAGSGDVAYAAHRALGRGVWGAFKASDTVGAAILRMEAATGYREYGASGNPPSGVMTAWGGADLHDSMLYGAGGSHGDTNFNGVFSVDLETFKSDIPVKPSVITPTEVAAIKAFYAPNWFTWSQISPSGEEFFVETTGPFAGRKMFPPLHTYGSVMLNAAGTKLLVPPYHYDLGGNAMSKTMPGGIQFGSMSVDWKGLKVGMGMKDVFSYTLLDPDKGVALASATIRMPYISGQAAAYVFDAAAYPIVVGDKVYTVRLAASADQPRAFPAPLAWSRDLPFTEGAVTVNVLTPTLKNVWSAADMAAVQPGAYFARNGVLYILAKDFSFTLTWNPRTGECGKELAKGAMPPTAQNGPFGRLRYYAKRDVAVLVNAIDQPVYAVRFWD